MKVFIAPFLTSRLFIDVEELRHTIRSGASAEVADIRKQTFKAAEAAVRVSRKCAPYRTKILRLTGLYYWLIGKQAKALKWWGRSIEEGERLGARPDLSRAYLEVETA